MLWEAEMSAMASVLEFACSPHTCVRSLCYAWGFLWSLRSSGTRSYVCLAPKATLKLGEEDLVIVLAASLFGDIANSEKLLFGGGRTLKGLSPHSFPTQDIRSLRLVADL